MTHPLTPEAVAQMVADREIGTEGPWTFEIDEDTQEPRLYGYGSLIAVFGNHMSMSEAAWIPEADARRATRLPDLEAAYLTLAAENATLRADYEDAFARGMAHGQKVMPKGTFNVVDSPELATLRASEAAARGLLVNALAQLIHADVFIRQINGGQGNRDRTETIIAIEAAITPTTNGDTP